MKRHITLYRVRDDDVILRCVPCPRQDQGMKRVHRAARRLAAFLFEASPADFLDEFERHLEARRRKARAEVYRL